MLGGRETFVSLVPRSVEGRHGCVRLRGCSRVRAVRESPGLENTDNDRVNVLTGAGDLPS